MLQIYCDGSANPNPGPSGYALIALRGQTKFLQVYQFLGDGTNQIGEMLAVRQALRLAGKREATIYTDSEWALNICSGKWKASCYQQTWRQIISMRNHNHNIVWVKGHNKNKYNDEVDKLAKKAVASRSSLWNFTADRQPCEEEAQTYWKAHLSKEGQMSRLRHQQVQAKKAQKVGKSHFYKKKYFRNEQKEQKGGKSKLISKDKK